MSPQVRGINFGRRRGRDIVRVTNRGFRFIRLHTIGRRRAARLAAVPVEVRGGVDGGGVADPEDRCWSVVGSAPVGRERWRRGNVGGVCHSAVGEYRVGRLKRTRRWVLLYVGI